MFLKRRHIRLPWVSFRRQRRDFPTVVLDNSHQGQHQELAYRTESDLKWQKKLYQNLWSRTISARGRTIYIGSAVQISIWAWKQNKEAYEKANGNHEKKKGGSIKMWQHKPRNCNLRNGRRTKHPLLLERRERAIETQWWQSVWWFLLLFWIRDFFKASQDQVK